MSYVTNGFDEKIINLLKQGGVGFMPSDTIYGLSARALDETAVTKLYKLKDRRAHKPFIILISNFKMLDLLSIDREVAKLAIPYWPGSITLICPAPAAPAWLHQGLQSLAVRIPDNPALIELINKTGPLISTSANVESGQPAKSSYEAHAVFGEDLDFYVDKGEMNGLPSTIVEVKDNQFKVIRDGAVKIEQRRS